MISKTKPSFFMKTLSFQTSLVLLLFFCSQSGFAQKAEKAEDLRKKAISFSESFQYDSAMAYYQLAKESFLKEGDTTKYYMSDVDIAFELLRKGLLKESQQMVEQAYDKGKSYMGDVDKGLVFRAIAHAINLQGDRETSLAYYDSVVMMLEKDTSLLAKKTLAIVSSDMGIMHYSMGDYKKAEDYWKESLGMLAELPPEKVAKTICEVSMNTSVVIQFRGGYFEATSILKKAHEVALEYLPENTNMLSFIRQSMARGYSYQAYYDKSIEYYRYLAQVLDQIGDSPNKIMTHYEIAVMYGHTKRIQEGMKYVKKGLDLAESLFGKTDHRISIGYATMGDILLLNDEFEASIEAYQEALQIETENGLKKSLHLAYILRGLGIAHGYLGRFRNRLDYLNRAMSVTEEMGVSASYYHAGYLVFIGQTYLKIQKPDSAIAHFQNALITNTNEFDSFDLNDYPEIDEIETQWVGYESLIGKSLSFEMLYDRTGQESYLKKALYALRLSRRVSQKMKQKSNVLEDKFRVQRDVGSLSLTGSRLHHKAYKQFGLSQYLDSMLSYMELGKSELILQSIQSSSASEDADKFDLIAEYEDIERGISHHKEQLHWAELNEDSSQIAIQTRNLYQLRSRQDTLEHFMNEEYDIYMRSRIGDHTQNLESLKQSLESNEILLNYQIGDSSLYLMSISKDTVQVFTKAALRLKKTSKSLISQLSDPKYGIKAIEELQNSAPPPIPTAHTQRSVD